METVTAARFLQKEGTSRLPALPRGMFFALLFGGYGVLKCRGIFSERLAFVACGIACLLSTGAWLVVASGIQRCADYERAANIELFIADPNAPVPPPVHGLDMPPRWLRGWNALNIALFVVLIGDIVRSLLALLPAA